MNLVCTRISWCDLSLIIMELKLFLRRNHIESCFIFSLLNYNRASFSLFVESSLANYKIIQHEIPNCTAFPTIQITQSSKTQTISTTDEILKTLVSKKVIKKGLSHSAWESQTYTHLTNTTYKLALGLPVGFFNRSNQVLRTYPKEKSKFLINSFIDIAKLTYSDKFITKQAYTPLETFKNEILNWQIRLNGQDFHGGTEPDKADFFMYSCVESNWIFVKFLMKDFLPFENWKMRMNKCSEQDHKKE